MADPNGSRGSAWRFLLLCAALGSFVALADCVSFLLRKGGEMPRGSYLLVPTFFATAWLLGGIVLLGIGRLAPRASTALRAPVALAGTFLLGVGLATNVIHEPIWHHPVSLALNGAVIVLAVALFLLVRRRGPACEKAVPASLFLLLAIGGSTYLTARSEAQISAPVETAPDHPSVLVLLVDTLRADHVSHLGYERETTPNLDRLAARSMIFERAHVPTSWTKPAVATLMTGLPPTIHTAENWYDALPEQVLTIAESFRAAGYRTALFSENPNVSRRFDLSQGFEVVFDKDGWNDVERIGIPEGSVIERVLRKVLGRPRPETNSEYVNMKERSAAGLNRMLLDWLDGHEPGEPSFGFVHYIEPHQPYTPKPPFDAKFRTRDDVEPVWLHDELGFAVFEDGPVLTPEERQANIDAYDGEIAEWDHHFAALMRELESRGRLENTVIVVVSDHGEAFYEHRTWDHGNTLYEDQMHVPLLIHVPDGPVGRCPWVVDASALPADLLRLAGFEPPPLMAEAGTLMLPLPRSDRIVYGKLRVNEEEMILSSLNTGEKWILTFFHGKEAIERFRLADDPGEKRNLAEGREPSESARNRLLRHYENERRMGFEGCQVESTPELNRRLRALGYLR